MDGRNDVVAVTRGAGRGTTLLAAVALIIALLALGLAWMAYNRTGADLEDRIQQQVEQSAQDVNQGAQEAGDAIDAGPDGVDEDDTDVNTNNSTDPNTTNNNNQ